MLVVKYAKYVGTMIGTEGRSQRHLEKITQRVQKINASAKSLVERLCDIKMYALSVSGYIGSISAPDESTLKADAHALQCTTTGPYNAIHTNLYVGSVCGLGPDLVGIHSFSLAGRYRTAACSNTLSQDLEKLQAARGYDFAPIFALSSEWEKKILAPSMARSTADAFTVVTNLMILHRTRNKRQPQHLFATNYMSRTLPDQSLYEPPEFLDRSVVFALWRFFLA